ncbi:MAG: class I SAM-dependent methyltransferase [Deltaproteobacteria bacterium]|nr:class I SAM-dependent methyltransferase [Deltaproteobacteria bacterium]
MPHKFNPENVELLIGGERVRELNPAQFLIENGLKEGMSFADIGCGPGFFSMPALDIVGDSGIVYAIDTQEEMLKKLMERKPPGNLKAIKSKENSIPLKDGIVDFALLAFVLHETEDGSAFLKEVKRLLRAGGSLLLLEWEKKVEDKGPPFEERIDRGDAWALIEKAGFKIRGVFGQNPSHYQIKAQK